MNGDRFGIHADQVPAPHHIHGDVVTNKLPHHRRTKVCDLLGAIGPWLMFLSTHRIDKLVDVFHFHDRVDVKDPAYAIYNKTNDAITKNELIDAKISSPIVQQQLILLRYCAFESSKHVILWKLRQRSKDAFPPDVAITLLRQCKKPLLIGGALKFSNPSIVNSNVTSSIRREPRFAVSAFHDLRKHHLLPKNVFVAIVVHSDADPNNIAVVQHQSRRVSDRKPLQV